MVFLVFLVELVGGRNESELDGRWNSILKSLRINGRNLFPGVLQE